MTKTILIAAAALGFVALTAPSVQAAAPEGTLTCRDAAKMKYPTDRKMRHEFRKACKQAWRAQKNAAAPA
jgi:hypothetical protein